MPAKYPDEYDVALALALVCDDDPTVSVLLFDAETSPASDSDADEYEPAQPCVEIHLARSDQKLMGFVLDRHAMAQLADWALAWKASTAARTRRHIQNTEGGGDEG